MSLKRFGLSREESIRALSLLKHLHDQPESLDFAHPVDFKALGLDDYLSVIKNPMDLSTIKKNLKRSQYNSFSEILSDLMIIWNNCRTYNPINSYIYRQADLMERHMLRYCSQHGIAFEMPIKRPEPEVSDLQEKIDLSYRIKQLDYKTLAQIVELIEKECPHIIQKLADEKIQLRFEAIDQNTLKKIEK